MRRLAAALALSLAASGAEPDEAEAYFEAGLGYLKTAFYADARAAFAESLVRAPGQPVPIAFLGVACAGEKRAPATCARLLRLAYERLPAKRTLQVDLHEILLALAMTTGARIHDRAGGLKASEIKGEDGLR